MKRGRSTGKKILSHQVRLASIKDIGCIARYYTHVILDGVRADYWRIVNGRQQAGRAA